MTSAGRSAGARGRTRGLPSAAHRFTPQEIQVAGLVREGRRTKEIAALLNLSSHAVHFHRKNIRRKLGLESRRDNLRERLLSLS